jgi:hypothetical protein
MNDPVSEFKAWFRSKPVFTRTYIASTFVLVIVYTFGWLGANHIYYDPTLTFAKLQVIIKLFSFGDCLHHSYFLASSHLII